MPHRQDSAEQCRLQNLGTKRAYLNCSLHQFLATLADFSRADVAFNVLLDRDRSAIVCASRPRVETV
jgi:hypothetical protein